MDNDLRIAGLNSKFALPGMAQIAAGNGGLAKIQLETRSAEAEICLQGAQITSWRPTGTGEVLFVSQKANWFDGKPIRGGIPVCFPWFRAKADDPHAPSHGFVRTTEWQIESIAAVAEDGVCVRFSIGNDDRGRKWWPFEFRLEYAITVGKSLKLELAMSNTGDKDLKFEEALHTYFKLGDARQARVRGLDGLAYSDNRDENHEKNQQGDLVLTRQTDNAYHKATGPIEIVDPLLKRRLLTTKQNSASTIVWNPWSDGAEGLSDFGADEWQTMLCVEGGNVLNSAIALKPGKSHTMTVILSAIAGT